jgi:5-methylcytosine-specific restriction endonuclease McrA
MWYNSCVSSPCSFTADEVNLCAALRHIVLRRERGRRYNIRCAKQHRVAAKKWRQQNPVHATATRRAYQKAHHEQEQARYEAWKLAHPEEVKTHSRNWARKHPKLVKQNLRKWRAANPLKAAEQGNRRRARKQGATGTYTAEEFATLGSTCLCCGRSDTPMTADHVIPLSKGGSNDIGNIQPLCRPCNSSKGTKSTDYRKRG